MEAEETLSAIGSTFLVIAHDQNLVTLVHRKNQILSYVTSGSPSFVVFFSSPLLLRTLLANTLFTSGALFTTRRSTKLT